MYGFEGSEEGDKDALFDYVLSRPGTAFENTGLASQSYVPIVEGLTLLDVVNRIMSILRDGDY